MIDFLWPIPAQPTLQDRADRILWWLAQHDADALPICQTDRLWLYRRLIANDWLPRDVAFLSWLENAVKA